jgi:hypothetical protein
MHQSKPSFLSKESNLFLFASLLNSFLPILFSDRFWA